MKLADLKRISALVSIRRLALACGFEAIATRQRIRRGQPELSEAEAKRIVNVLEESGLRYDPPGNRYDKAPTVSWIFSQPITGDESWEDGALYLLVRRDGLFLAEYHSEKQAFETNVEAGTFYFPNRFTHYAKIRVMP